MAQCELVTSFSGVVTFFDIEVSLCCVTLLLARDVLAGGATKYSHMWQRTQLRNWRHGKCLHRNSNHRLFKWEGAVLLLLAIDEDRWVKKKIDSVNKTKAWVHVKRETINFVPFDIDPMNYWITVVQ